MRDVKNLSNFIDDGFGGYVVLLVLIFIENFVIFYLKINNDFHRVESKFVVREFRKKNFKLKFNG